MGHSHFQELENGSKLASKSWERAQNTRKNEVVVGQGLKNNRKHEVLALSQSPPEAQNTRKHMVFVGKGLNNTRKHEVLPLPESSQRPPEA